jgi:hypothetical protein
MLVFCFILNLFIMTVTIHNMTPHPITIMDDDTSVIEVIPCSGWELRLSAQTEAVAFFGQIPITKTAFGPLLAVKNKSFDGQANPWGNVNLSTDRFVVSQMVKNSFKDSILHDILLVPAEVVRDENGNIIGCKSLGF